MWQGHPFIPAEIETISIVNLWTTLSVDKLRPNNVLCRLTCIVWWMLCMKSLLVVQLAHHCWTIVSEPTTVDTVLSTSQRNDVTDSPVIFHNSVCVLALPRFHWNEFRLDKNSEYSDNECDVYIHFDGHFVVERRTIYKSEWTFCLFHGQTSNDSHFNSGRIRTKSFTFRLDVADFS